MLTFSRLPLGLLALTIAAPVLAAEPSTPTPSAQPTSPAAMQPATPAVPSATHQAAVAPKAATVDINSATASDLKALPGVNDAEAAKIVQGRPYRDTSDLVSKKIMTEAAFAKVKDHVVAGHPKS